MFDKPFQPGEMFASKSSGFKKFFNFGSPDLNFISFLCVAIDEGGQNKLTCLSLPILSQSTDISLKGKDQYS